MGTTFHFETQQAKLLNTVNFAVGQKIRIAGHTDPDFFGSLTGGHILITITAPHGEFSPISNTAGINILGDWYFDFTLPNTNADAIVTISNGPDIIAISIFAQKEITIGSGSSGTINPTPQPTSSTNWTTWLVVGLVALAVIAVLILIIRKQGANISVGSKSLKVGGKQ